jgi:beta-mannosidase
MVLYVPIDPFESRVDSTLYRRLIESSIASNYNMLRLWSSGNYYADDLYSIADERAVSSLSLPDIS